MINPLPKPLPRTIVPCLQIKRHRERRQKALSTGLATICTDGLVLCAEQMISNQVFNYYECKIKGIPLAAGRGTVAFGYAGQPSDTMKTLFENLEQRLHLQDKTAEQIRGELQATLNEVLKKDKGGHQLLCAFEDNDSFRILKTYNKDISPASPWDCIGFGDSALMRYLGAIFLGTRIHLPLRRAVPICVYMVAQAKKYVPSSGAPTDLIVLGADGRVVQMEFGTQFDTACDEVESALNGVLTWATEPGMRPEGIQRLIENMAHVLDTYGSLFIKFLH